MVQKWVLHTGKVHHSQGSRAALKYWSIHNFYTCDQENTAIDDYMYKISFVSSLPSMLVLISKPTQ